MKQYRMIFCTALCLLFFASGLQAQTLSYDPKTGDVKFDIKLKRLNVEAKADLDGYLNDLSKQYKKPIKDLKRLMDAAKMQPADLYMALRLADLAKVSLIRVEREYKQNRKRGWGAMARNLGIKPGSPEFHELKRMRLKKTKHKRKNGPPHKKGKHGKKGHDHHDHDDYDDDDDDDDDHHHRKKGRKGGR